MFDIVNGHMPIKLQMALSNNEGAFYEFLRLSDVEQDAIIERASKAGTYGEALSIVAKIAENAANKTESRLK